MPIDPNSIKWDATPAQPAIDAKSVKWDEQPTENETSLKGVIGNSFIDLDRPRRAALATGEGLRDLYSGMVRGAGSIGATLLRPIESAEENTARRQKIDMSLKDLTGADPESLAYKTGKLTGEVAGTAGAGGLLAKPLQVAAPRLAAALESSGFSAGQNLAKGAPVAQRAADIGIRMTGGAASGGASAGLIDPNNAEEGAIVGGLLPPVAKVAGAAGSGLRNIIKGPPQTPEAIAAVKAAQDAGYVIPPTQAKPTLGNRLLEGFSGKLSTAQNASAKNAEVTNRLAAEALGLPGDTQLTPAILSSVRKQAGQAYDNLGVSGVIKPGPDYTKALDAIVAPHITASKGFPNAKASPVIGMVDELRSPSFDAQSAMAKISELRSAADDAFRAGSSDVGRASKKAADAIENAIEQHLSKTKQTDLLENFREARKLYAKTYTVEKALNPTTGTVDARKLGSLLKRGKPLTDELRDAAEFANRFPKAAQPIEGMGSLPQTSPLDWTAGGLASLASGNVLPMTAVMARPAARNLALSPLIQNQLTRTSPDRLKFLMSPEVQQLGYRAAPVISNR